MKKIAVVIIAVAVVVVAFGAGRSLPTPRSTTPPNQSTMPAVTTCADLLGDAKYGALLGDIEAKYGRPDRIDGANTVSYRCSDGWVGIVIYTDPLHPVRVSTDRGNVYMAPAIRISAAQRTAN